MSATMTRLAWAVCHPRAGRLHRRTLAAGRHPITRREQRWFRSQAAHAGAFGNPDAARMATLAVDDFDPKFEAGLGHTRGVRP